MYFYQTIVFLCDNDMQLFKNQIFKPIPKYCITRIGIRQFFWKFSLKFMKIILVILTKLMCTNVLNQIFVYLKIIANFYAQKTPPV